MFVPGQIADRRTGCLTEKETKFIEHLLCAMSVLAPHSLLTQLLIGQSVLFTR